MPDVPIHCPQCGSRMHDVDGWLTCPVGNYEMSTHLRQVLQDIVTCESRMPEPSMLKFGHEYHCPADGSELDYSGGRFRCRECGRYVPAPAIYELIEFNLPPSHLT